MDCSASQSRSPPPSASNFPVDSRSSRTTPSNRSPPSASRRSPDSSASPSRPRPPGPAGPAPSPTGLPCSPALPPASPPTPLRSAATRTAPSCVGASRLLNRFDFFRLCRFPRRTSPVNLPGILNQSHPSQTKSPDWPRQYSLPPPPSTKTLQEVYVLTKGSKRGG